MDTSTLNESVVINPENRSQRRHLFKAAIAVAAGGGLNALTSNEAMSAEPNPSAHTAASKSSAVRRSPMAMPPMQDAIKACLDCHSMCLQMATGYCLERGGRHVEQKHLRLMLNCAELCQTSANFMLSNSPLHGRVCLICAEVCEACAKSCDQVGDMRECAEECRSCAKSCKAMT